MRPSVLLPDLEIHCHLLQVVVTDPGDGLVACQLSFVPCLTIDGGEKTTNLSM